MNDSPINLHTADMIADILTTARPTGTARMTDGGVDFTMPDHTSVLRIRSAAILGPGVGWSVDAMGPSDWEDGALDTIQTYSVQRVLTLKSVIDHCFGVLQPALTADALAFVG